MLPPEARRGLAPPDFRRILDGIRSGSPWVRRVSPAVPVNNLVEGPAAGPGQWLQRPVGRVAQANQEDGPVAIREPEHLLRLLLVDDCRVAGTDAKVSRRQHHVRGRLAEVIHQPVALPLILWLL